MICLSQKYPKKIEKPKKKGKGFFARLFSKKKVVSQKVKTKKVKRTKAKKVKARTAFVLLILFFAMVATVIWWFPASCFII